MKFKTILFNFFLPLLIIVLATFVTSFLFGVWFGYPAGHDALFHIFKTKFILLNFPHHHWWNIWAGGMPLLTYYPPLPNLLLIFVNLLSGISLEILLTMGGILAVALGAYGIFLLVLHLTRNHTASFLASLLYLTCPSVWESAFSAGVYMRAWAIPFFIFSIYFSVLFWQNFEKGKVDLRLLILTSTSIGMTLLIHQHITLIALGTLFFLAFLWIEGRLGSKIALLSRIVLFSLLLSASFWLPMIFYYPQTPVMTWVSPSAAAPVPFFNLLFSSMTEYQDLTRLTPFLLPLVLFLAALTYLFESKRLRGNNYVLRILKFSGWMSLLWAFYSSGSLLRLEKFIPLVKNLYFFMGTMGALWFLPIFLSICGGILVSILSQKWKKFPVFLLGVTVLLTAIFLKNQYTGMLRFRLSHELPIRVQPIDSTLASGNFAQTVLKTDPNSRVAMAATDSQTRLTFSNQFPAVSQTGHHFLQGVSNFNLYYYFESVLANPTATSNEFPFFLNWWAVSTIISRGRIANLTPPDLTLAAQDRDVNFYDYKKPSPLLSVSTVPTLLVIGRRQAYEDSFFRSLALGNQNSDVLIPLLGKTTIEDYSLEELSQFDFIFLYDYQAQSLFQGAKILEDYVTNGGNLIIESNRDLEISLTLPDPFPISKINSASRQGNWNFEIRSENPLIAQPDLASFSPPEYRNGGWGISEGESVKDWARGILNSQGKIVLVEGQLGKGRVLWSGLNLPYHIALNENQAEAIIWKNIFLNLKTFPQDPARPQFKTIFKNPEERVVMIENSSKAKGVLLKENFFPNWKAVAQVDSHRIKLKIYQAGPGFMYVFLPDQTKEVTFSYQLSWLEKSADLVSFLSLFYLAFLFLRSDKQKWFLSLPRPRLIIPRRQ